MSIFFRVLAATLAGLSFQASSAWAEPVADAQPKTEAATSSYNAASLSGSFLSGRFAKEHGDQKTAIHYLEEALAKDPKNSTIASQLLVLALMTGDMPAAVSRAHALENAKEHEPLVDLVLAVDAVRQNKLDDAQAHFKKVFSFSERALWAPLFNAWVEAGRGKLKKPLKPADILPNGQTAPAFLAYQLALVNDVAGFTKVAQEQYDMAVADHAKAPFRAVEAAADFYRRQNDQEKLTQLRLDYMSSHPDDSSLVSSQDTAHIAALMQKGEGASASAWLVGNTQEGVAEVLFTMASVLYSAEAPQDTKLYLRMALYLRPDFPLAQLLLGSVLEDEQRFAEAADVYAGVNPKNPLFERALLRRVFMIEQQGHLDQALAMLDERAKADPKDFEAYVVKGDLLRDKSRFEDAAKAYSDAIARIPNPEEMHWGIFFARGVCYERASQWDAAEADLRKALALSPNQPEALNYLGYSLLVRNRNIDEGKKLIEKAYALQPTAPYIIDSMGWALYMSGDAEGAVARLEQAIEQMPGDATVNEHLGDAYWQVGRKTEARYQWERALTSSPEPDQEKGLRRKLKDGLPPMAAKPPGKGAVSVVKQSAAEITD